MSARDALRELARLGLSARMQGTGVVVEQTSARRHRRSNRAPRARLVLNRRPATTASHEQGSRLGDQR